MPISPIIVVASHRRSGTHLTIDSLRSNAIGVAPFFLTLEALLPKHKQHISPDEMMGKLTTTEPVIIKTHAFPTLSEFNGFPDVQEIARKLINQAPTVYVLRHGPDVVVSFYEYQRALLPRLNDTSFSEFLRTERRDGLSLPRYWRRHVSAWQEWPNTKVVHYEAFHQDYLSQLSEMCDFLGLAVKANPTDMVLSRNAAATDQSSSVMFRKGRMGDWNNYFSAEDVAFFDAEVAAEDADIP